MNAKKLTILFVLIALLLSACSEATESTTVVEYTQPQVYQTEIVEVVEVAVEEYYAPPAPLATQAPLGVYEAPEQLPAPTPIDMTFQNYGVNPYIDTREDHLSTFAMDVDTASYSVARSYVEDGNLPPAEAVRVEEFVNYFNMGYPTPPDVAFGIYADGAPSPFQADGTHILRIGIQGYEVPEWERKAASLIFVIDVSGSMDMENRLGLVKRSLTLLVDRLRADDTVGIVIYGSEARTVLYPTRGSDRSTILAAINSLRPEGSTNAEAGLRMGYQMAMQYYRPDTSNRIILCSDGVANVGATGPGAILEEVRGYVAEGVYLTTVGFGMGNFNDVLMEQLANDGNGNYAYVDDIDEAQKLFVEDLTSTLQVIARDARVQVDFNSDVVSYYRLIGYENRAIADEDFRNDYVDAGEIGAGHSVTALYAVMFRPGVQGRIATVQMRWEDPDTYEVIEINGNFNTWDLAASFEQADPRYQLAVLVAQYAELLRRSPWAQGSSSFAQLYYLATPLVSSLDYDADVVEFVNLLAAANQIQQ